MESCTQTRSTIISTYTLKSNKTLSAGSYMKAAQFSLNGTAQPYTAGTYSVPVTPGGVTQNYPNAM